MYKIYNIIVIMLCIVLLNSCMYKREYYHQYADTDDLGKYEYGIDGLLNQLNNDKNEIRRMQAAGFLGQYACNESKCAREILLKKGLPGLLSAYEREGSTLVRCQIIWALGRINPEKGSVISTYVEAFERGWECNNEAYLAMWELVEYDYDLAKYVPDMIENIRSGEKLRVEFGFSVLERMGRYAYSAIPMLEEIREMKELNSPEMKDAVDKTIAAIQRDKEKYKQDNNERKEREG